MPEPYTDFPPDSLEYIYGLIWSYVKEENKKSLLNARNLLYGLGLGFRYTENDELEAEAVFLWDLLYDQQAVYLNEDSSQ